VKQKKGYAHVQPGLGFTLEVVAGELSINNNVDISEYGGGEVTLKFHEALMMHAELGRLIADQEIWKYDVDENGSAVCCVDDA
jgi:hypothetical protein